jgi:hypothetical protein
MTNQAFKKALETKSELARELNDFNTVIQKKDADTLTLFSYFKRTSANFDLGGQDEPDHAVFSVSRSELMAWQRCVDFMNSDPLSPDYVHVVDDRLELYSVDVDALEDESNSDLDDNANELFERRSIYVRSAVEDSVLSDHEGALGRPIHRIRAKYLPEGSSPDIEELVISQKGHVFIAGSDNHNRWEVNVGNIKALMLALSADNGALI